MPELSKTGSGRQAAMTGRETGSRRGNQHRLGVGYGKGGHGAGCKFKHDYVQPLQKYKQPFLKQKTNGMEN